MKQTRWTQLAEWFPEDQESIQFRPAIPMRETTDSEARENMLDFMNDGKMKVDRFFNLKRKTEA